MDAVAGHVKGRCIGERGQVQYFYSSRRHLMRPHGREIDQEPLQTGGVLDLRQYVGLGPSLPPVLELGVHGVPRAEPFNG